MHAVALRRQSESKHFHFRKLVNAIETASCPAMRAGLRAKAVTDTANLQRQFVRFENAFRHRSAQRYFCSGHQREVGAGDRVDLGFGTARHEARAFENGVASHVGSGHDCEVLAHQEIDGILLESQLKQYGIVGEKIKSVTSHAGTSIEVEKRQPLAEFNMVNGLKIKLFHRRPTATNFNGSILAAKRSGRMGEVGNRP